MSGKLSPEAQRFLDGDRSVSLGAEERHDVGQLHEAIEAYAATVVPPDARLDGAVMNHVRRRARERAGGWRWLFQPRPITLRPVWVPVLAAALVAVVWLSGRERSTTAPPGPAVTSRASDTLYVRFELRAPGAQAVSLAGSFNGWTPDDVPLTRHDNGLWSVTIPLSIGEYEYQFVVDGSEWLPDPTAHAEVDDGFGGRNSVLVVGRKGVVRS